MAAPPTITENNALYLATQATLKRSQRPTPKYLRLLGAFWSTSRTRLAGRRRSLMDKTLNVLNARPKKKWVRTEK